MTAQPGRLSDRGYSPTLRTAALIEALPYIQQFRGAVIVVKLGGNAMVDDELARTFAEDIVLLRSVGLKPVVVHGGGPQIGELLAKLGKESEFRDGLRVTDAETLDVARMVLVGKVGRDIIGQINMHGAYAVGMSGEDGGLIRAEVRDPELGFVGDIVDVNPGIVERLLAEDLIPVVSSIGVDASGQALNINADTVAGALGGALEAEKVVYLTNVAGLLTDVDEPASLVARATIPELKGLIATERFRAAWSRRSLPASMPSKQGPPALICSMAGSPCAVARTVHRRRHRHHDHAAPTNAGLIPTGARTAVTGPPPAQPIARQKIDLRSSRGSHR